MNVSKEKTVIGKDGEPQVHASFPKVTCAEHPVRARHVNTLYGKHLIRALKNLCGKTKRDVFCRFCTESSGRFLIFTFTVECGGKCLEFADSYENLEPFSLTKAERETVRARASNIVARRQRLGDPLFADAEKIAAKRLSAAMMIPYEDGIKLVYPAGMLAPEKTVLTVAIKLGNDAFENREKKK